MEHRKPHENSQSEQMHVSTPESVSSSMKGKVDLAHSFSAMRTDMNAISTDRKYKGLEGLKRLKDLQSKMASLQSKIDAPATNEVMKLQAKQLSKRLEVSVLSKLMKKDYDSFTEYERKAFASAMHNHSDPRIRLIMALSPTNKLVYDNLLKKGPPSEINTRVLLSSIATINSQGYSTLSDKQQQLLKLSLSRYVADTIGDEYFYKQNLTTNDVNSNDKVVKALLQKLVDKPGGLKEADLKGFYESAEMKSLIALLQTQKEMRAIEENIDDIQEEKIKNYMEMAFQNSDVILDDRSSDKVFTVIKTVVMSGDVQDVQKLTKHMSQHEKLAMLQFFNSTFYATGYDKSKVQNGVKGLLANFQKSKKSITHLPTSFSILSGNVRGGKDKQSIGVCRTVGHFIQDLADLMGMKSLVTHAALAGSHHVEVALDNGDGTFSIIGQRLRVIKAKNYREALHKHLTTDEGNSIPLQMMVFKRDGTALPIYNPRGESFRAQLQKEQTVEDFASALNASPSASTTGRKVELALGTNEKLVKVRPMKTLLVKVHEKSHAEEMGGGQDRVVEVGLVNAKGKIDNFSISLDKLTIGYAETQYANVDPQRYAVMSLATTMQSRFNITKEQALSFAFRTTALLAGTDAWLKGGAGGQAHATGNLGASYIITPNENAELSTYVMAQAKATYNTREEELAAAPLLALGTKGEFKVKDVIITGDGGIELSEAEKIYKLEMALLNRQKTLGVEGKAKYIQSSLVGDAFEGSVEAFWKFYDDVKLGTMRLNVGGESFHLGDTKSDLLKATVDYSYKF